MSFPKRISRDLAFTLSTESYEIITIARLHTSYKLRDLSLVFIFHCRAFK